MKLSNLLIIIFAVSNVVLPQSFDDPMKFFPAKTGNMWEYFYIDPPYNDTIQVSVYKDSIDHSNQIFSWQLSKFINPQINVDNRLFWIDSLFNVYSSFDDTIAIYYKLNALQGDSWVIRRYNIGFHMVRVDTVYESQIFFTSTLIKTYRIYYTADSLIWNYGLDRDVTTLAYNFGLVQWIGLEGQGQYLIKGCVIDGILYGDTTQVLTSVFDDGRNTSLKNFKIQQNYPNPFNAETNIMITNEEPTNITIQIFDVLGNLVKTLVENKSFYTGNHLIRWDAKDDQSNPLSSGIYFYKVYNKNQSILKKMILLK